MALAIARATIEVPMKISVSIECGVVLELSLLPIKYCIKLAVVKKNQI